jgi:hypothetical protein
VGKVGRSAEIVNPGKTMPEIASRFAIPSPKR